MKYRLISQGSTDDYPNVVAKIGTWCSYPTGTIFIVADDRGWFVIKHRYEV